MPAGWYEDTDPEALEVFLQLHRQMTPSQRVARVFELTAGEREVFLRVAARRLDRETMIKAYGWDPELNP
jgi:hypothetical protein